MKNQFIYGLMVFSLVSVSALADEVKGTAGTPQESTNTGAPALKAHHGARVAQAPRAKRAKRARGKAKPAAAAIH